MGPSVTAGINQSLEWSRKLRGQDSNRPPFVPIFFAAILNHSCFGDVITERFGEPFARTAFIPTETISVQSPCQYRMQGARPRVFARFLRLSLQIQRPPVQLPSTLSKVWSAVFFVHSLSELIQALHEPPTVFPPENFTGLPTNFVATLPRFGTRIAPIFCQRKRQQTPTADFQNVGETIQSEVIR